MSTTCKKCGGSSLNEISGECAICSNHRQYEFKKAYNTNTETDDSQLNEVLRLLRSGKKWRIQKARNSVCWHPGVKMTNGKCVFCHMNAESAQPVPPTKEEILNAEMERVQKEIVKLQLYLMKIASGDVDNVNMSHRQYAINKGAKWYLATTPCHHCGIIGERYVANGRCRNCGK